MKLKPKDLERFPGFIRWWAIYPRKVGKGAALQIWHDLECETYASEVIKGTKHYHFSDEKKFIPHPSTFLNQWRWTDEESRDVLREEF